MLSLVTVEGSGVPEFTVRAGLVVLDVEGDELLDPAGAEVRAGTGVVVAMNPVMLEHFDASTLVPIALAKDDALLLKTSFEHIELPTKLLDYFLRSNKSNIN